MQSIDFRNGWKCPSAVLPGALPGYKSFPTLLATRLQMELLLGERCVDLRAAAGILLNDLGATLAIFARAGEEIGGPLPERLEDCLALLCTEVWMEAVCGDAVERIASTAPELNNLTAFWEHGRLLAYAAWTVAGTSDDVCPEQAYLVGLLHEAGRLPALLGWESGAPHAHRSPAAERRRPDSVLEPLPQSWYLPNFLEPVLASPAPPPHWRALLDSAHAWSRGESCLLGHTA